MRRQLPRREPDHDRRAMRARSALLLVCATLNFLVSVGLQAVAKTRQIVLLFGERPTLPGLAVLYADFARTLSANSPDPVEIYSEAMDLSRFRSDAYQKLMAD